MAKDSDALAYQAAALSDTVRVASLRRLDFLDRLCRLAVLALRTLAPLRFFPCFSVPGLPTPLFHTRHTLWEGLPRRAGQRNLKSTGNVLNYLELSFPALSPIASGAPRIPKDYPVCARERLSGGGAPFARIPAWATLCVWHSRMREHSPHARDKQKRKAAARRQHIAGRHSARAAQGIVSLLRHAHEPFGHQRVTNREANISGGLIMLSKFLAATALGAALIATPALAQSKMNPSPSNNEPFANKNDTSSSSASSSSAQTASASGLWQGSKLIGMNVYNDKNDKIGDIKQLMVDKEGAIKSVVIGVGGFLGMGERDVAVKFSELKWSDQPVSSSSNKSTTGSASSTKSGPATYPDHAVYNATKDQLKAMPQFDYNK
ncbi:MAG TPA: PRC-barrel domain-containing protein [Xanthobacteraceae bacterium]